MSTSFDTQTISVNSSSNISNNNANLINNLQFPINLSGKDICLSSAFLYYSWPNITSAYGDNLLQFNFPGAPSNPYNVSFPDGQYGINDIGNFIQFVMGQLGFYLVDNNGNYIFYISLVVNATTYAVTISCSPVPSSLPSGWSNPNNITLSGLTPQLIIPNPSSNATYTMNQLLGFTSGTYPPSQQTTLYQIDSNGVGNAGIPEINPVESVSINLNLVAPSYFNSNPQTIYTFSPSVQYGALIEIIPTQLIWLKCVSNQFSFIQITFTDQQGNMLNLLDPKITVNLYLRDSSKK